MLFYTTMFRLAILPLFYDFFQAIFTSPVSTYGWQHAYFSLEHQDNAISLSVVCIFDICNKPRQLSQYHYSLGIFSSSLVLSLSSLHLSFSAIFLPLLMNHFAAVLEKIPSIMRSCFSEWGRKVRKYCSCGKDFITGFHHGIITSIIIHIPIKAVRYFLSDTYWGTFIKCSSMCLLLTLLHQVCIGYTNHTSAVKTCLCSRQRAGQTQFGNGSKKFMVHFT